MIAEGHLEGLLVTSVTAKQDSFVCCQAYHFPQQVSCW